MLRDGTIEKDMLDEFARRELDYSRPNELTVTLPKEN
jgi:cell division protein FtsB